MHETFILKLNLIDLTDRKAARKDMSVPVNKGAKKKKNMRGNRIIDAKCGSSGNSGKHDL